MATDESSVLGAAQRLLKLMLTQATAGGSRPVEYTRYRGVLLADPTAREKVPSFVRSCRDPDAFSHFINSRFLLTGSHVSRRQFLYDEFEPLLEYLERADESPHEAEIDAVVGVLNAASVTSAWTKAVSRRATDPEGAITAARSLLESVCKTILDDVAIEYNDRDDLPKLYRAVSERLKLAPSDHTEEQFRAILGGCTTVVNGLGSIRNRASDAHGQGRTSYRPASRHAALAVNLAGSMALFLVETHEARKPFNRP